MRVEIQLKKMYAPVSLILTNPLDLHHYVGKKTLYIGQDFLDTWCQQFLVKINGDGEADGEPGQVYFN